MAQAKIATAAEQELVSDADHVQLQRLVTEHAMRVDNGHADTVHELYTEDGELDIGNPTPLRGRPAIREWGRKIDESPPWRSIRHVVGNTRFVSQGPDAAEGTTVMTVYMVAGSGPATTLPWTVGEDHDRFVRTDRGWRLTSRRWVGLFARGDVISIP